MWGQGEGGVGLSPDIRKHLKSLHSTDNYQEYEEVVLEKDEDGFQLINYPIHTGWGSDLFSLDSYEEYMDFAQDELRDITSTFWWTYKGDV